MVVLRVTKTGLLLVCDGIRKQSARQPKQVFCLYFSCDASKENVDVKKNNDYMERGGSSCEGVGGLSCEEGG